MVLDENIALEGTLQGNQEQQEQVTSNQEWLEQVKMQGSSGPECACSS